MKNSPTFKAKQEQAGLKLSKLSFVQLEKKKNSLEFKYEQASNMVKKYAPLLVQIQASWEAIMPMIENKEVCYNITAFICV
jgi:hypothetical protein